MSSKHSQSQTGRARELTFWQNVHPTLCVMCHVSCVMCHMSHGMCHMSHVTCPNIFFTLEKNPEKKWTKWWSFLVEGLLSTRPTLSSFTNLPGKIWECVWLILLLSLRLNQPIMNWCWGWPFHSWTFYCILMILHYPLCPQEEMFILHFRSCKLWQQPGANKQKQQIPHS